MTSFTEFKFHFIRGRSQNQLDNLLPVFAHAMASSTPASAAESKELLKTQLSGYFPLLEDKTLNNYATEIISKLFGMKTTDADGICTTSELTAKLLEDADQPAFFKVLASRIQAPNPMNKLNTFEEERELGANVRPLVLVLEVLKALKGPASYLELRTFVLANLHAYRGEFSGEEIAAQIIDARANKLELPNPIEPNVPYNHQHIREMLSFLKLANLVVEPQLETFYLNPHEDQALAWIFSKDSRESLFRMPEEGEKYTDYQAAWSRHYGSLASVESSVTSTSLDALNISADVTKPILLGIRPARTTEIGRIGEELVLSWQIDEVTHVRPQDLRHVKDRSAERGIGFDIQSIWLAGKKLGEFRFFEVKTTKRSTKPVIDGQYVDFVSLTSNEYRAARTHGSNFTLARVYLFPGGFRIYCIDDPVARSESGDLIIEPADWNLYLNSKSLDTLSLEG